ncbi:adenosylcobinamide-phosphate synthase [Anaerotaenia torta]
MAGFFIGFVMDRLFGDPYWLWHPIRQIGSLIAALDRRLLGSIEGGNRDDQKELRRGVLLVILVLTATAAAAYAILAVAYSVAPLLGLAAESIMTYQILAAKCLKVESMKVYQKLREQDLEGARKAVAMIVGRDTQQLDEEGVAKAAIETVAENTSDGVIAPMLFLALGGPVLGFLYKAVNTMDSMVGYKNDRYLYFGRAAARLDDILNYIPARISALLMILACPFAGAGYHMKPAWRIYRRDRRNHASPNSAHTEAVCAGALGIRLAGDASYSGKIVQKPYIGDAVRPVEDRDIIRVNRLMYLASDICQGICLAGMLAIYLYRFV